MELSPQSTSEIQKLLRGELIRSGNISVGPLDATTRSVLEVLVQKAEDFQQVKGAAQAQEFRKAVKAAISSAPTEVSLQTPQVTTSSPRKWKLFSLKCRSIRGIAPPGEDFQFPFWGESLLISGPNGSGKSSLVSAVLWVLTGKITTDSESTAETAPMLRLKGETKVCEWEIFRTLPNSAAEAISSNDNCYAQIELKDHIGSSLYLRRDRVSGLASSEDAVTWEPCSSLDKFGISPLDLQLSLSAPCTFGKKAIETAEDTRSLLSAMLGYDDLEILGDLASAIARSRTILFNSEAQAIESKWTELKSGLNSQLLVLSDGSESKQLLSTLAQKPVITSQDVTTAENSFSLLITGAEQALALLLGISGNSVPGKLADNLTVLLSELELGFDEVFPKMSEIGPETLLNLNSSEDTHLKAEALKNKLRTTLVEVTAAIASRHAWWTKETAAGSKAALLLKAAHFYHEDTDTCPVCEKAITDDNLRRELIELGKQDEALGRELRALFSDLSDQIEACFSNHFFEASENNLEEALSSEWNEYKKRLTGMGLAAVLAPLETSIQNALAGCKTEDVETFHVLPTGAAEAFLNAAESIQTSTLKASRCLSLLNWSLKHSKATGELLHSLLCGADEKSLLSRLSAGKDAAAELKPLVIVRDGLKELLPKVQTLEASAANKELLSKIESPLDELKKLTKYATSEVANTFEVIQTKTVDNWRLLYPEESTGVSPLGLVMKKGRDKSVEGLLSGVDYKVPLHHFANAGWQRAAALAFYFALLNHHPHGLDFFVLDDPILSLDDEHRERWATEILKPVIGSFQVIFATHQRQFVLNCKHYFPPQCVIELNPRNRRRAISWRPGHDLKRAQVMLESGWGSDTPARMRQFREYLIMTVEAYSPTPFMLPVLRDRINHYRNLPSTNPLTHTKLHLKICDILDDPVVANVLDAGSHAETGANLTDAMNTACLEKLVLCDGFLRKEVDRLEELRTREMRRTVIPSRIIPFPKLPETSHWNAELSLKVVGRAAAKSGHYVVDLSDEMPEVELDAGSSVLVATDALEPVAKRGQWILLGPEIGDKDSGALAALVSPEGRYLRRIWPDRERWILQSINPVAAIPSISVEKIESCARKVIGVLYEPETFMTSANPGEWSPHGRDVSTEIASASAIQVVGHSLAPIALSGQKILVDRPITDFRQIKNGALVVVETDESDIGIVIKRIFTYPDTFVLVSPNPVDSIPPIIISKTSIKRAWNLRGVLFEAQESV
jgi:energy-coupling factor transporter ATP-binding protein EcfA2